MSESTHRKRIGDFLVERGMLREESIDQILEHCEAKQLRFGEAALELGLISAEELKEALATPYHREIVFHLESRYFPLDTKEVIPLDRMIEFGVLPLGKKKITKWFTNKLQLNVGTLSPENPTFEDWWLTRPEEEREAYELEFFQVLPGPFLEVLKDHYGTTESSIKSALNTSRVSEVLRDYIERADEILVDEDPARKGAGSSRQ